MKSITRDKPDECVCYVGYKIKQPELLFFQCLSLLKGYNVLEEESDV